MGKMFVLKSNSVFGDSGQLALPLIGDAEIVVIDGDIAVQSNRLADQGRGNIVAPALMGEDPQKMQTLGVVRIDGENLPIMSFRFAKITGLVELARKVEQFGDAGRCCGIGGRCGWSRTTISLPGCGAPLPAIGRAGCAAVSNHACAPCLA